MKSYFVLFCRGVQQHTRRLFKNADWVNRYPLNLPANALSLMVTFYKSLIIKSKMEIVIQGGRKVPGHSIFNILNAVKYDCFNILMLLKQFI